MKILFVLDYYYPQIGGGEKVFQRLAEFLAQKNNKVVVITQRIPHTSLREFHNKVKIIRVNSFFGRLGFALASISKVLNEAKNADLIHCSLYSAAFPTWLAGRILKKPTIITIHEIFGKMWLTFIEGSWFKAKLYQWWEKFLISLSFDYYIAVSLYTYNSLRVYNNIPDAKMQLIYHGIDRPFSSSKTASISQIRDKLKLPKKNFLYLFFGRPGVSKGVEYLIQAVAKINKRLPNSKLVLLLASFPQDRYQKMIKMVKKINKNSIILRSSVAQPELIKYLKAVDCVVIPSLTEGFGLVAAESSAMKKPIVVSQVASLPEVVSGRVVFSKPADSKSIAEGVIRVALKKWTVMPNKKFYWFNACQSHLKLYQKIIKND